MDAGEAAVEALRLHHCIVIYHGVPVLFQILAVLETQHIDEGIVQVRVIGRRGELRGLLQSQVQVAQAPVLPLPCLDLLNQHRIQVLLADELEKRLVGIDGADHRLICHVLGAVDQLHALGRPTLYDNPLDLDIGSQLPAVLQHELGKGVGEAVGPSLDEAVVRCPVD